MSDEITVKPSKCCLDFVGHKIGEGQLMTKDDKVERVQEASVPRIFTQVRSFLGLTGYYRRFTPNDANIATPLTDLTN